MKPKRGFIPGSGENVASRIRQIPIGQGWESGNPQLVLVHYSSGQAVRKSHSPSKIYSTLSTFSVHYFMKNSPMYRPLVKGLSYWNPPPPPNSIAVHAIKHLVAPRSLRWPTLLESSRLILPRELFKKIERAELSNSPKRVIRPRYALSPPFTSFG